MQWKAVKDVFYLGVKTNKKATSASGSDESLSLKVYIGRQALC